MNKNIRRILSAVLSLAMTLSLAACGEKNSSAQPGSTGADGEKNTELNVALAGEPNALDPMCGATDRTSSAVYNNIYDTLLKQMPRSVLSVCTVSQAENRKDSA